MLISKNKLKIKNKLIIVRTYINIMEDLVFLIFCFLSIIHIDVQDKDKFFNDYMDIKYTNPLRGIFVWIIGFYHYKVLYRKNKYIHEIITSALAQNLTSIFFFYSGYGIFESLKKNGKKYIKTLPKKIIILYIKTQIIIFIYFIVDLYLREKVPLKTYLLSLIFLENIQNSKGFPFTILCFYFYSFISFIFIKNKKFYLLGIISVTILCSIHFYLVYNFLFPKEIYNVNNTFCFVLGFYYSLLRKFIDKFILKNDAIYYLVLFILMILYYKFYLYGLDSLLTVFLFPIFTLIIILASMKVRFNNGFLLFFNSHSYSFYQFQNLVIRFFEKNKYFKHNEFIGLFFIYMIIILLSIYFDKYSLLIDNLFKYKHNISDNKISSSYETLVNKLDLSESNYKLDNFKNNN